jgi:hypothetical protein
MNSC